MSKKIISLLMVIVMMAAVMTTAVVSAGAKAQDTAATGDDVTYYLIGSFNSWDTTNTDYPFVQNAGVDGEYVLKSVLLPDGAGIKVRSSDGIWYPDQGEDYTINKGYLGASYGLYDIYFRPDGAGGEDWYYGYFYVKAAENVVTNTVYFTKPDDWSAPNLYFWYDGDTAPSGWPGQAMTWAYQNSLSQQVYTAEVPAMTVGMIFNDGSKQTVDIGAAGIEDGTLWYTTGEKEGNRFKVETVATAPVIKGYTLSLDDEIAINFYAYIEGGLYNDITATYSYGTGNYQKNNVTAVITDTNDYDANKKITCRVNARAMTDEVTLTVKSGETTILTDNYSVVGYTEQAAQAYGNNNNLKQLLCAMLDYGASVQTFFGYQTDNLANKATYINKVIDGWTSPVAGTDFQVANDSTTISKTTAFTNVTYLGSQLSASGVTVIRLYFQKKENAGAVTVKVNGQATELLNNAGKNWYIEIPCSAKNIFDDYSIQIDNDEAVTYNAVNYYNFAKTYTANANLANVLQRMYVYYLKAKAA